MGDTHTFEPQRGPTVRHPLPSCALLNPRRASHFIASISLRLLIRQSSIENIYYMRTNHLIIIELLAHVYSVGGAETEEGGGRGYRSN